jgi:hypothetical protein
MVACAKEDDCYSCSGSARSFRRNPSLRAAKIIRTRYGWIYQCLYFS